MYLSHTNIYMSYVPYPKMHKTKGAFKTMPLSVLGQPTREDFPNIRIVAK